MAGWDVLSLERKCSYKVANLLDWESWHSRKQQSICLGIIDKMFYIVKYSIHNSI